MMLLPVQGQGSSPTMLRIGAAVSATAGALKTEATATGRKLQGVQLYLPEQ